MVLTKERWKKKQRGGKKEEDEERQRKRKYVIFVTSWCSFATTSSLLLSLSRIHQLIDITPAKRAPDTLYPAPYASWHKIWSRLYWPKNSNPNSFRFTEAGIITVTNSGPFPFPPQSLWCCFLRPPPSWDVRIIFYGAHLLIADSINSQIVAKTQKSNPGNIHSEDPNNTAPSESHTHSVHPTQDTYLYLFYAHVLDHRAVVRHRLDESNGLQTRYLTNNNEGLIERSFGTLKGWEASVSRLKDSL